VRVVGGCVLPCVGLFGCVRREGCRSCPPGGLSWLPVAKVTTSVVPPGSRASASMNKFMCALLPGALVVGSFGLRADCALSLPGFGGEQCCARCSPGLRGKEYRTTGVLRFSFLPFPWLPTLHNQAVCGVRGGAAFRTKANSTKLCAVDNDYFQNYFC
jgi:hypothetical protein